MRSSPGHVTGGRRPVLFLMVGLPGAGKTTVARQIAVSQDALRLTPDEWHLALLGSSLDGGGKRDVLEALLTTMGLRALRLGTSVVLDFGLWGRDERSALRWLARDNGAECQIVYVPVDLDVQLTRIAQREQAHGGEFFAMPEAAVRTWRTQFQVPDAAELDLADDPQPPSPWRSWADWAADRWPTLQPHDM